MPMRYDKLFELLKSRGLNRQYLLDVVSEPTVTKLGKGQSVSVQALCSICAKLRCDISDIAEYEYNSEDCKKQECKNHYKG